MKKIMIYIFFIIFTINIYSQIEIVITPEDKINYINANSINKLLESESYINILSKSFKIIQSDIFMDGDSFEHTSIYLDGVKINDPQTGHYNLDIPVPVSCIENVNVDTTYDNISGAINLLTRKYKSDKIKSFIEYGSFNTFIDGIDVEKKINDFYIILSGLNSFSDGYHYDTDYIKNTVFLKMNYKNLNLSSGYEEKNYGAYDFYTPGKNLPSREFIITKYTNLNIDFHPFLVTSYLRSHYDKFLLNNEKPDYYQNKHNTLFYGSIVKYEKEIFDKINFTFKYNFQREEIQSSNLGNHYRNYNMAGLKIKFDLKKIILNGNLSVSQYDIYNKYDFLPSAKIVFNIFDNININLNFSYNIRYPNFTELYYVSPYNKGNPDLLPEESYKYSLTINTNFLNKKIKTDILTFYKNNFNLIDWGKDDISSTIWKANNIKNISTLGGTIKILFDLDLLDFGINYTYLKSTDLKDYISKYGNIYLSHKIVGILKFNLYDFFVELKCLYKKYINRYDYKNSFDVMISKNVLKNIKLTLNIENVFDDYYEEVVGIPTLGRFISGRLDVEF